MHGCGHAERRRPLRRHLGRLPRRGRDPRVPRLPRVAVPRRVRRLGRRATTSSSPTCSATSASATGTPTDAMRDLEADGIVAEVIFPNTIPPFFPGGALVTQIPPVDAHDLELRWAGLQAHNRWLADFCARTPGRRAGIAQILLHDVDRTVEEIRWAHANGLTGGILLPGAPPGVGLLPLHNKHYDPIWTVCEELGMPVNHHGGSAGPPRGMEQEDIVMFLLEVTWWSHNVLTNLIVGGALERHPESAVRVHRAGHRVGARLPRPARLLLRPHAQRGRLAGTRVGPARRREDVVEAERVLGAPVPHRCELHATVGGAHPRAGGPRPDHVGQRLPAQGVEPPVLEGGDPAELRRASTRSRCR